MDEEEHMSFSYYFFCDSDRDINIFDIIFCLFCVGIIIVAFIFRITQQYMGKKTSISYKEKINQQKESFYIVVDRIHTLYTMRWICGIKFKQRESERFVEFEQEPADSSLTETQSCTSVIEESLDKKESSTISLDNSIATKNISLDITNKKALKSLNLIGKKIEQFKVLTSRSLINLEIEDPGGNKCPIHASIIQKKLINALKSPRHVTVRSDNSKLETRRYSSYLKKDSDSKKPFNKTTSSESLKSSPSYRMLIDDTSRNNSTFGTSLNSSSQLTAQNRTTKSSFYGSSSSKASSIDGAEQSLNVPLRYNTNASTQLTDFTKKLTGLKKSHSSLTLNRCTQNNDYSSSNIKSNLSTSNPTNADLRSVSPRNDSKPNLTDIRSSLSTSKQMNPVPRNPNPRKFGHAPSHIPPPSIFKNFKRVSMSQQSDVVIPRTVANTTGFKRTAQTGRAYPSKVIPRGMYRSPSKQGKKNQKQNK